MLSRTVSMKCVREFCQVTGTDEETARSFLSACNDDLDLAVSLYMDDPSRVPSHSTTEEYRSPIPQRNEQLLPAVVPLLPTHLQNPAPLQKRRRAFVADDSDDSSGDDVILTSERSSKPRYEPNSSSSNTEGVSSGSSSVARSCGHVNGAKDDTTQKKKRHLQQLYQPPVELLFSGSLNAAAIAAQEKHQWLLVSVHDEGCFECHLLNRDVWKDPKVYQLVKYHCTFLQLDSTQYILVQVSNFQHVMSVARM
ncbi:unnamed protein product [Trichobilharzia szidati]|nr:unnamed protein product [Trichobilharzia szidati]